MDEKEIIRHFLATIYYRGMKYLSVNDLKFNSFTPKNDIRTPAQILNHINGLLQYIRSFFVDVSNTYSEELDFIAEVDRFKSFIKELDSDILSKNIDSKMTYHQILQGPLSDIMLHIGELSMQRKFSESNINDIENYINADIKPGTFI